MREEKSERRSIEEEEHERKSWEVEATHRLEEEHMAQEIKLELEEKMLLSPLKMSQTLLHNLLL